MGNLISVADLAERLGEYQVLDVRYRLPDGPRLAEYRAGHLPGAAFVDLDRDLADPPGPHGRHPLPEPSRFVTAMRRCGVDNNRPVVVYDNSGGVFAARAWWLLHHYGHQSVRLLDGGWVAWVAEGMPVSRDENLRQGNFDGVPGHALTVTADTLEDVELLVDARASARFLGAEEPIDTRAGRIPGAKNFPAPKNLAADGRFNSTEQLRQLWSQVGIYQASSVAVYCGSGVSACLDVLALAEIGVEAALYPGSWSEWITNPERLVATG